MDGGWRPGGLFGIILILAAPGFSIDLNKNGEYTNIVLKVEDDIPEDSCASLLNNLKGLLESTNRAVTTGLEDKLWLGQVTLVVPGHWRQHKCQEEFKTAKGQTRYKKPDILLQRVPAINPTRPWTQQSGGCGQAGDHISLPLSFVSTWNSTDISASSGKLLAHEFIKLRFGIFDEIGFPGDPLYPSLFWMNGQPHPTGVSDQRVQGNWVHGLTGQFPCYNDSQCVYHPSGPNNQVTCSLGTYPLLPQVTKYCSPEQLGGREVGPTKQRVMCGGRNAWEVINDSDDMKLVSDNSNDDGKIQKMRMRIDIVRQPSPTHVLVLETTADMQNRDDWKYINKAAHKLIKYDLPDSTRLGVVSFSNTSRLEAPLTSIRGSRGHLADIIPDKYRLARPEDSGRCVLCGVNMAMTEVLGEHKEGAHIIIVTRAGADTLSDMDMLAIREYVEYYQIRISVIMVPEHNLSYLPFYDEISHISGGKSFLVQQDDSPVRKYWSLVSAFHGICDADMGVVTVYTETKTISQTQSQSSGSFLVDSSLGRDTVFGIIVEDEEDHLIDNVVFENERGEVYGPYSHIATTFDSINMKTISFGLSRHQPFGDRSHVGQQWRYTITWHTPTASSTREAVVMVSSRPSVGDEDDVEVDTWTSAGAASVNITDTPLTMFVSVTRGGYPVVGARVHVFVEIGDSHQLGPIQLHDTGNGDPDTVAGDGVYTRYLLDYPTRGRYVFSVHVSSVTNVTRVVIPVNDTSDVSWLHSCCGSRVTGQETELTDPFTRVQPRVAVVRVTSVPGQTRVRDQTGPPRIADLHVHPLSPSRLVARWTVPVSTDHVTRVHHVMVMSTNLSQLLTWPGSEVMTGVTTVSISDNDTAPAAAGPGTSMEYEIQSPTSSLGQQFYVGVIGLTDGAKIPGKMSNLVNVILPSPSSATVNDDADPEMQLADDDGSQSMVILGVCVSLLLLAICLICAVLYFVKFRNHRKSPVRRQPSGLAGPGILRDRDDLTDNTSCSSDARNNSGNNLMPDLGTHVHTISGGGSSRPSPGPYLFTAPPPSLPDSTPTYWSATKLLTEHEQRALAMSYAPLAGGHLSAIHEEYIGYPEEYHPDDDSLTYSITSAEKGITNPSFRHSNVMPVYVPEEGSDTGSHVSHVPDTCYDGDTPETPVRFSTAVQTIAPSTIARLRQNDTYLASLRTRNVSLV